jgi:hypothetical protein
LSIINLGAQIGKCEEQDDEDIVNASTGGTFGDPETSLSKSKSLELPIVLPR